MDNVIHLFLSLTNSTRVLPLVSSVNTNFSKLQEGLCYIEPNPLSVQLLPALAYLLQYY